MWNIVELRICFVLFVPSAHYISQPKIFSELGSSVCPTLFTKYQRRFLFIHVPINSVRSLISANKWTDKLQPIAESFKNLGKYVLRLFP
jgi:hypothetical protein